MSKKILPYEEMLDLIDAIYLVQEILDDREKTAKWFIIKNPLLGNMEPIKMFILGRGHKVLKFIRNTVTMQGIN